MSKANGSKSDDQAELELDAAGAPGDADEQAASGEAPEEEGPRIVRLISNSEGCWKELEDGRRIDLSEEEWRTELARQFRKDTPKPA